MLFGGGVGVDGAIAFAVPIAGLDGDEVAEGLLAGVGSTSSHGGMLVPVPNCRSLMICSASPSVAAGMVAATSCCE